MGFIGALLQCETRRTDIQCLAREKQVPALGHLLLPPKTDPTTRHTCLARSLIHNINAGLAQEDGDNIELSHG